MTLLWRPGSPVRKGRSVDKLHDVSFLIVPYLGFTTRRGAHELHGSAFSTCYSYVHRAYGEEAPTSSTSPLHHSANPQIWSTTRRGTHEIHITPTVQLAPCQWNFSETKKLRSCPRGESLSSIVREILFTRSIHSYGPLAAKTTHLNRRTKNNTVFNSFKQRPQLTLEDSSMLHIPQQNYLSLRLQFSSSHRSDTVKFSLGRNEHNNVKETKYYTEKPPDSHSAWTENNWCLASIIRYKSFDFSSTRSVTECSIFLSDRLLSLVF